MSRHTPGPWMWRYCVGGYPELVCPRHGLLLVMDSVRAGMNRATLRFAIRTPADKGGLMRKAEEFMEAPGKDVPDYQLLPANPDMRLIAASPTLLDHLRRYHEHDQYCGCPANPCPVGKLITDLDAPTY